jgi:hypothetical protein
MIFSSDKVTRQFEGMPAHGALAGFVANYRTCLEGVAFGWLHASNSHFGLSLVSPTLESGIQHFYKAAIGVMDA